LFSPSWLQKTLQNRPTSTQRSRKRLPATQSEPVRLTSGSLAVPSRFRRRSWSGSERLFRRRQLAVNRPDAWPSAAGSAFERPLGGEVTVLCRRCADRAATGGSWAFCEIHRPSNHLKVHAWVAASTDCEWRSPLQSTTRDSLGYGRRRACCLSTAGHKAGRLRREE